MFSWFRRKPQPPPSPRLPGASDGYSRIAVGDLLVDVELPADFLRDYEESGCMVAWDAANNFALRISGITVQSRDPQAMNLAVKDTEEQAAKRQTKPIRVSDSLIWYAYTKQSDGNKGPLREDYWIAGVGNRCLVLTLSYLEADAAKLDLLQLHGIVERAIRSTAPVVVEQPRAGDQMHIMDLADSQRPWLDHHRRNMIRRIRQELGYEGDGLVPLKVLDELWGRFIAAPPTSNDALNVVLNGMGVLFGDHLVQGRNWEWVILHDAYGMGLAVATLRGKENLNCDPFNYVAKRWERKEVGFLESGYKAISQLHEEWLEKKQG